MTTDEKTSVRKQVGELLRAARGARSLNAIGQKIGVSAAYLSDVEHGHRTVSAQRLQELSEALGMSSSGHIALFTAAHALPPAVHASVLQAPSSWGDNYRQLHHSVKEVVEAAQINPALRAALGPLLRKLTSAIARS